MPFFILFILIPLSEIMVFMSVSDKIGLGTALLMALFTAILGGMLVKHQGIHTMLSARTSLDKGAIPSKELFDGLCIVAAGATLITPGFITDAIGFALLVPAIRNYLRQKLSAHTHFQGAGFRNEYTDFHDNRQYQKPHDPNVIEAEYETLEDSEKP